MKKICCIFNYASHYRQNIFCEMDKELNCDFYFGDSLIKIADIKEMDLTLLNGFKSKQKVKHIWRDFYWQSGLLRLLFKYDTFILTGAYYCINLWLFLYLCRSFNKNVYLWTHGWYGKESRSAIFFKKIFYFPVKGFFVYSNYAKNLMIENNINSDKIFVIYNSLDYDQQLQIRQLLKPTDLYIKKFNNNNSNLIFIGRLTTVKKIDLLLEAIHLLKKDDYYVNLTLIGEGEQASFIKEKIDKLNINDQIWLYGSCYDEKLNAELLYNADLCISPGNVGLTAIHSLSYGTPIITHSNFTMQMPEFEAIIPGVTGTFFEEDNIESLALSIKKWLGEHTQNREVVRKKAYEVIDKYYNPYYQVNLMKLVIYEKS